MARARPSPPAQHCRSLLSMGCVPEPSVMLAELLPSDSAPPISPEQELSPRGSLILLLLPASCCSPSSQEYRAWGELCSSQGPAPVTSKGYILLLSQACNSHPSPKPNNASQSPFVQAHLQTSSSHTSISFQSYSHLHLTGSAPNA